MEHAYAVAANKLENVLEWCWELDVKIVSVWVFSTENFNRPEEQVEYLMRMATEKFRAIREDPRTQKHRVHVKLIGKRSLLDEVLLDEVRLTEESTEEFSEDGRRLNICLAYGGRTEILDATRKLLQMAEDGHIDADKIDEELFSQHLYTQGLADPDLVIRTSGEERLSGFLLWQTAYSELYFADVYWPLFRKIDLYRAIRVFQQRSRRYGK